VQRDADLVTVLEDGDVVRLAHRRLAERNRQDAVTQGQPAATGLDVDDDIAVRQRVLNGSFDFIGRGVAFDDRSAGCHGHDDVREEGYQILGTPRVSKGRVAGPVPAHRRELPSRRTTNPYASRVAEVTLDHTQVARLDPRYEAGGGKVRPREGRRTSPSIVPAIRPPRTLSPHGRIDANPTRCPGSGHGRPTPRIPTVIAGRRTSRPSPRRRS
jgi:hypothetical protein